MNNDIFEQFLKKNKAKFQEDKNSNFNGSEESEDSTQINFEDEDFSNNELEEGINIFIL